MAISAKDYERVRELRAWAQSHGTPANLTALSDQAYSIKQQQAAAVRSRLSIPSSTFTNDDGGDQTNGEEAETRTPRRVIQLDLTDTVAPPPPQSPTRPSAARSEVIELDREQSDLLEEMGQMSLPHEIKVSDSDVMIRDVAEQPPKPSSRYVPK